MPAFYQRSVAGSLPLTPPDSGSGYGYSSMHYAHDPYATHQSMNPIRHDSGYDYQQQPYMQPPVAQAPPAYQYSQSTFQPTNSLPPIQYYDEPIGAPILPPLRIHDQMSFTDDYARRVQQQEQQRAAAQEQQRQAAKDEKATGGVSAKLDYDMEQMTDFVAQATQSIFRHTMQSAPSFRKWVHQVLSATRLPSATILLSLHYLNTRFQTFPNSIERGENQIYRLLSVALILGSKFLDDNTFINRSWSDVTAIKVTELNLLEMKWLQLINYSLHVDIDAQNGLQAWLDAWHEYEVQNPTKQQQQTARLSPLDTTNVYRHSSHRDKFSPYPSPYSASTRHSYDTPQTSRSAHFAPSSYTTVDPWASTDRHGAEEFYKRQSRYPALMDMEVSNHRASEERSRQAAYAYPQNNVTSYYQPSTYGSGWDQHAWNGVHPYSCNCTTCSYQQHFRPYSSSYGAQTVMG